VSPLPPDFEARKQAARRRSAEQMVLNRLREHGIDPSSFPYRFLSVEEEDLFWDAIRPTTRITAPLLAEVADWTAASGRVTEWASSRPEVAIWYDTDTGNGGLVLPGRVVAANPGAVVRAVGQTGNVMMATPDGRGGCVYFEEEYKNVFAAWDRGSG
jgi:hypothetical protein